MSTFKPMLAATVEDVTQLRFPLMASPKLDGIRAFIRDGQVLSRNLKPIPNHYTQRIIGDDAYNGVDGELIVGDPTSPSCFRDTTSGVMSVEGEPSVVFYAFDALINTPGIPFAARLTHLKGCFPRKSITYKVVPHKIVKDAFELYEYETTMLEKGFEGVMLRDPDGLYKYGRSTMREGWLMKMKRFRDSEADVIGFEELMHNENEKTLESGGKAKRSSHKAGLVPMNTLGTLLVRDIYSGVEFGIGSGFTAAQRDDIWKSRNTFKGRTAKYKFFPSGSKDKPRFPVFLGFREKGDMS